MQATVRGHSRGAAAKNGKLGTSGMEPSAGCGAHIQTKGPRRWLHCVLLQLSFPASFPSVLEPGSPSTASHLPVGWVLVPDQQLPLVGSTGGLSLIFSCGVCLSASWHSCGPAVCQALGHEMT